MKCKTCGSDRHTAFKCHSKPRKPLRGKRRLRKIGKIGRQWWQARDEWIKKHLPDNGHWNCYYCGAELYLNTLTLDHKHSRSRRPDLRFDEDNLVPCCASCNTQKGSLSADEFLAKRGNIIM